MTYRHTKLGVLTVLLLLIGPNGLITSPTTAATPATPNTISIRAAEHQACQTEPATCWPRLQLKEKPAKKSRNKPAAPIALGCPAGYECEQGGIQATSPCAIPEYICQRESKNWIDVHNSQSSASGRYQFVDGTWEAAAIAAGYPKWAHSPAAAAPEAIQNAVAAHLWDGGNGCGHWAAC